MWESLRKILDEGVMVKLDFDVALKIFQTDIINIKNITRVLPSIIKASNDKNTKLEGMEENLTKLKNHYVKSFSSFKSQLETFGSTLNSDEFRSSIGIVQGGMTNGLDDDLNRLTNLEEAI